jgi:ferredoxin
MKKLSADKLYTFLSAIAATQKVYLPVDDTTGNATWQAYREGVTMSDKTNTVRSAKDFFFPQTENLVDFKMEGKSIEVVDVREECEDFVLFGVRACDATSFDILDRVYLYSTPVDTYYKNRREHGTVVTLACTAPDETCFCSTFGIDAADPAGDVTAWQTEDGIVLRANTEKGEALLAAHGDMLEPTDDAAVNAAKERIRAILARLPLAGLSTEGLGKGLTKELFNRPEWASLSEACLGCGTCTFVCPTCQCYDIRDFDTGHGIKRFRCWDSCMYSDFTKMAHGNPRTSQLERFRQRFMHKLVYFPDNNDGVFGCVGCGRCLSRCPISMNIVKVMRSLKEANKQ